MSSRKRDLLKLLQFEEKKMPTASNEFSTSSSTSTIPDSPKNRSNIVKRRTKKHLGKNPKKSKHVSKKTNTCEDLFVSFDNSRGTFSHDFITTYSDSDIEMNERRSKDNWSNKLEVVSPSKSECEESITSNESMSVDTIYYMEDNLPKCVMFTSSEEASSENSEHTENIFADSEQNLHTVSSSINLYNMNDGRIAVLTNKENIYFHSAFKLNVLSGSVELLGSILKPSSPGVEVYSLRGFSYLYIKNTNEGDTSLLANLKEELKSRGVSKENRKSILSNLASNDTVIACSTLHNFKIPFVERHISQKLLPSDEHNMPLTIKDSLSEINVLQINPLWDDILTAVDDTSKVIICGGKGVGKSTLLRYMINKLLAKYDKILVIDLDPGQSEFTIPGCLSGVIVEEPIFGPNFTHLINPERCIFVEHIDVSLEPETYIKCVKELLKQCEEFTKIPTLINYMGYSQSYGINIASTVISYVRPTALLQINSSLDKNNFLEDLTPDVIRQYSNMFGAEVTNSLFYDHITIDSMCDGLSSWKAQGRIIREMCVLSYLSQLLDSSLSLTSRNVPLYEILLEDIILVDKKFQTISNKIPIFNGNLVNLCSTTELPNIYNCHGWGIVKGINKEKLVLITPLCLDSLAVVTHLVIGSVSLPPALVMSQNENTGLIPYVSLGCISTFNAIPKRSYLPKKSYT